MIKLENDEMEVLIAPQYGGKIWRAYDKRLKRDLFLDNPALQPANFANRGAWVSGGVEWNWNPGRIGHSEFTLSPVYAASLATSRGPVVRVWEYDRHNSTTWQVDILLQGPTLYVHPRVENRWADADLRGYWWTNVAMATSADGADRIVAPAKWDIEGVRWPHEYYKQPSGYYLNSSGFGGLKPGRPWAHLDFSYLANLPAGNDFFFELCDAKDDPAVVPPHCAAVRPRPRRFSYIALASPDGYTSVHGHRGLGTKFFTYGATEAFRAGQFLQDFMAAARTDPARRGRGNYLEQQTSPEQVSQFHTAALPAHSVMAWTEWYRAAQLPPATVHTANYTRALSAVDGWIESTVPQATFDDTSTFLEDLAATPVSESQILARGMPWGGLAQLLLANGSKLSASQYYDVEDHAEFGPTASREARPWRELLANGTFSRATLRALPTSFVTDDTWVARLHSSAAAHGATWLHHLHIGVAAAERGEKAAATAAFEASWKAHKSPTAARNLALTAATADAAWTWLLAAWTCAVAWSDDDAAKPNLLGALSREMATWAVDPPSPVEASLHKLRAWLTAQSPTAPWRDSDPVQFATAKLALLDGDAATAAKIVQAGCWPTFLQPRQTELKQLWLEAQYALAAQRCKCTLGEYERHKARLAHPLPPNLQPSAITI